MLVKTKTTKKWIRWAVLWWLPMMVCFAADDSAQQALQQLKILQNRFLQKQENNAAPGGQPNQSGALQPLVAGAPQPQPERPQQIFEPSPPTLRPAPPSPPPEPPVMSEVTKNVVEQQAFQAVQKQLFPLTPKEIVKLHQLYNAQKKAEVTAPEVPPKPTASSQFVNLSPGSTPPVIRLAQGFVSSLVFLDSTGAPWPITAYDLGDPASFNIQWDHTSNTLMIQATKLYNYGNLAVRLKDLNTPVMLTLIPGQEAVDYRVDLRVQGHGPNATGLVLDEGLPPSANDVLLHVLDGVPPDGSQRLKVSGGDALGWLLKDRMYIRTSLTVLSPGWLASMTSADGTHAYEMMKSPVLLVSWHGKVMQLIVEGL